MRRFRSCKPKLIPALRYKIYRAAGWSESARCGYRGRRPQRIKSRQASMTNAFSAPADGRSPPANASPPQICRNRPPSSTPDPHPVSRSAAGWRGDGFAPGAAIGAAQPSTETEDEFAGEALDATKEAMSAQTLTPQGKGISWFAYTCRTSLFTLSSPGGPSNASE